MDFKVSGSSLIGWKRLGALQGGGDSGGEEDPRGRTGISCFPERFLLDLGHPPSLDMEGRAPNARLSLDS